MARSPSTQYVIKFESTSVAEAGVLAEDLREAILDACPGVADRCLRLDGESDVADPFGQSARVFEACAESIGLAVQKRIGELIL